MMLGTASGAVGDELKAVVFAEAQVRDQQVRRLLVEQSATFGKRTRRQHDVACVRQERLEAPPCRLMVLDNQNPEGNSHHPGPSGATAMPT